MIERIYYTINEDTARTAQNINSFRDYVSESATAYYKSICDEVYDEVDKILIDKPSYIDKLTYMSQRYAKKYADYLNAYYRNEASCPSVMICGAGNFPTRKKEKQNRRRDALMDEYNRLIDYKSKIMGCNNSIILSSDEDAIERLQDKINDLEAEKENMKAINAYYRKNGSLEDYPGDISDSLQKSIDFVISHNWARRGIFDTTNINAEIRRLKGRVENLTRTKEAGTTENKNEHFTLTENVELMRLQLFFDTIPSAEVRDLLKHNGFKWSPKNQAWQRQLTDNARFAYRRIEKELCNLLEA